MVKTELELSLFTVVNFILFLSGVRIVNYHLVVKHSQFIEVKDKFCDSG